jgi:hypothetical protein
MDPVKRSHFFRGLSLGFISLLSLTACNRANVTQHGGDHAALLDLSSFSVREEPTSQDEIAFSILQNGSMFTNYGVNHTKEMHLIVVRDDLQYFSHLHPTRDPQGAWRVSFRPEAGGAYWMFADFVDREGHAITLRFKRTYAGPRGEAMKAGRESVKTVDGYRVELRQSSAQGGVTFTYFITDAKGQPVTVEDYLGAKGHSVILSLAGDYIHAHAIEKVAQPTFTVTKPNPGFYRMYTQFQIGGKVKTVFFDWNVT